MSQLTGWKQSAAPSRSFRRRHEHCMRARVCPLPRATRVSIPVDTPGGTAPSSPQPAPSDSRCRLTELDLIAPTLNAPPDWRQSHLVRRKPRHHRRPGTPPSPNLPCSRAHLYCDALLGGCSDARPGKWVVVPPTGFCVGLVSRSGCIPELGGMIRVVLGAVHVHDRGRRKGLTFSSPHALV